MTRSATRFGRSLERTPRTRLAFDSGALILTSALTSGVGILFWTFAARMMSPQALGIDTALLSLIVTAGTITAIGTGNSFTALLPIPACDRRQRLLDGYLIVGTASMVIGVVTGVIAIMTLQVTAWWAFPVVAFGTVVAAFFALKDSVMIGLGGAIRLPLQNLIASLAKISLLPVFVWFVWNPAVMSTLVASAAAALIVIGFVIPRLTAEVDEIYSDAEGSAPDRRAVALFSARDGLANTLTMGTVLALPFLTTAIAGPVEGAVLALALFVAQGLELVTGGVGTALVTSLARRGGDMQRTSLLAWGVTQAIVTAGAGSVILLSPVLVALFGSQYNDYPVAKVMALLVIASVARVPFAIWSSLLRAREQTGLLLVASTAGMCGGVPAIVYGAAHWGAVGAASGLLVGSVLLGLIGAVGLLARLGQRSLM